MTIGFRIKQRRKELNISVEELAKRLGKYRSTVYRYENGDIENMPLDVLEPIAKALDTTPAYLMGWDEIKKENDILSDIILRMRSDKEFLDAVKDLNELKPEKLIVLSGLLKQLKD